MVWLRRLLLGVYLFIPLAFSGVWKRVLILAVGVVVGFAGPVLALPNLPPLHGENGWFWDALATEAYQRHEYKDVILAVIPAAFICFTDFMNHVLDDEYRYADNRIAYNGIFTILVFMVISVAVLPFSFAAFTSDKPTFMGTFDYSWPFAKLVLAGALLFEIALGCTEALRQARTILAERRPAVVPAPPTGGGTGGAATP